MLFFRLDTARIKIHQIAQVIFGTKSQFSSNFASLFSVMRHSSSVLFHLKLYICFGQTQPIKVQVFGHSTARMELTKFLLSFFKPRVSFPLKFASPFSVMTHNSFEMFQLKDMLWIKRAHQSTIFQTSDCSNESSRNSSSQFWKDKARVYSNFASRFSVRKNNSVYNSVFFSSNLI